MPITTRKMETVASRMVAVVCRASSIAGMLGRKQLELKGASSAAKETIATRHFFLRSLRAEGAEKNADGSARRCDALSTRDADARRTARAG